MKRYLVFAGDKWYPSGGWDDFKGDFNTIEEGKESLISIGPDWWHIVDSNTGHIVYQDYKK